MPIKKKTMRGFQSKLFCVRCMDVQKDMHKSIGPFWLKPGVQIKINNQGVNLLCLANPWLVGILQFHIYKIF